MNKNKLTCRAITLETAQWIGNAAQVAGGFVAIVGPRLNVGKTYDPITGEVTDETIRCHGLHAFRGHGWLLLAVPTERGLAAEGVPVSHDVVTEWINAAKSDRRSTYDESEANAIDSYLAALTESAIVI